MPFTATSVAATAVGSVAGSGGVRSATGAPCGTTAIWWLVATPDRITIRRAVSVKTVL